MRLGGGLIDGGDMAAWQARSIFLDTAADIKPEILDELRENILPLYKDNKIIPWSIVSFLGEYEELKNALVDWAVKYNLNYDWVYETALITLWSWSILPEEERKNVLWQYETAGYWLPLRKDEMTLTYKHKGWDPAGEDRAAFKRRVLDDFKKYIERYQQEIKELAQSRGFEEAPLSRKQEHFRWAVHSLIEGYSNNKIADMYPLADGEVITEDMVYKAVSKVRKWIGID